MADSGRAFRGRTAALGVDRLGPGIGARPTGRHACGRRIMALELLVTAWSAGLPPAVAVTGLDRRRGRHTHRHRGHAARIAAGRSTAHTDPAAWASRINLAAVVGVLIKAICGRRPRPRAGNPAPRS